MELVFWALKIMEDSKERCHIFMGIQVDIFLKLDCFLLYLQGINLIERS